jgi:hypothetical protein
MSFSVSRNRAFRSFSAMTILRGSVKIRTLQHDSVKKVPAIFFVGKGSRDPIGRVDK